LKGPVETEQHVEDSTPDAEQEGEASEIDLLEEHRDFLLKIEARSRFGHSVLGGSALVLFAVSGLVTWVLLSLWVGLAVGLAVFMAVMIVGRRLYLLRQDVKLITEMDAYCADQEISPAHLLEVIQKSGRYAFVEKLLALWLGTIGRAR